MCRKFGILANFTYICDLKENNRFSPLGVELAKRYEKMSLVEFLEAIGLKKPTLMDIDEEGRGFNPRRVDPLRGDEIVEKWHKEAGSKNVEK